MGQPFSESTDRSMIHHSPVLGKGEEKENDVANSTLSILAKAVGLKNLVPPPLHPVAVLAIIPMLPTWFFLNRGFTQWWHWCFIFYFLIGKPDFLRHLLVLQGTAVCVGWYSAVTHDYLINSRFCHLLYNNMPSNMRILMLTNAKLASGGIITNNLAAVGALVTSHIIDFVAHPVLLWVIWKMHKAHGGNVRNLLAWDVLCSSYALSRVYSMTHQYYNDGFISGLFYYGYEVYHIDTLESYTAAYVGEAILFVGLACWKLYLEWMRQNNLRFKIHVGEKATKQYRKTRRQRLSKSLSSSSASSFGGADDVGEYHRKTPALMKSMSSLNTMDSTITDFSGEGTDIVTMANSQQ